MTPRRRVLVVGPSQRGDMAWFLAIAYRRLGWQVAVLDDRACVLRGARGGLARGLQLAQREGLMPFLTRRVGALLLERARSCDHVVTVKGEYFDAEHVAAVAAHTPIVNWHPDHPVLDQQIAAVPQYTAFCPKDGWSTERLRGMGFGNVTTLPHASDPLVLQGARTSGTRPQMSVVGNIYPYRLHWIRQAQAQGVGVSVFGGSLSTDASSGWPPVEVHRKPVFGAAQGEALRTGMFTLNTHHTKDVAGGNQRLFDAAAAGAPQLTEWLPETVKHFKPGTEICTFEDADEFRTVVRELVGNPTLREQLAASSQERLREEHTYEHRIQALLALL